MAFGDFWAYSPVRRVRPNACINRILDNQLTERREANRSRRDKNARIL